MKQTLALLLLIFTCLTAGATDKDLLVKGIIFSETDSLSLIGSSVELLSATDSTSIGNSVTDQDGKFQLKARINDNSQASYLLKVSYLGHASSYTIIQGEIPASMDLGTIFLSSSNSLSEVVVSADKVIQKVDRVIITPSKTDLSVSSTSTDLINTLNMPGLSVNNIEQSIKINGLDIIYQINGREQTKEQFSAIAPQDVARIEYYDSPTGRYMNREVGGVINLILKEKITGGNVFANALGSPVTGYLNGFVKSSYNYKNSEFSVLYNNNWKNHRKRKVDTEDSFVREDEVINRISEGLETPYSQLHQYIETSYTYQDKRSLMNATLKNYIETKHSENESNVFTSNLHNEKNVHRKSSYGEKYYIPTLDVYYRFKINETQSIEANLVGTILNSHDDRIVLDDGMQTAKNRTNGRRRSVIGEVFHKKSYKNLDWNVGVRHLSSFSKNTYGAGIDETTKLNIEDSYVYSQIAGKINRFSYDASSGLKIYHINNRVEKRSFVRNLSMVNLQYSASDNIKMSYRFRLTPNLPSLSQLSDVVEYQDEMTAYKGNVHIKSFDSFENRLMFSFSKKKLNVDFSVDYDFANNPIQDYTYYDENLKVFVSEYLNQKRENRLNTQISARLNSLLNHLNISATGGWQRFESEGTTYDHTLYNMYWRASVEAYYKKWSLTMGYEHPQKNLYGERIVPREKFSSVMLMYKHKQIALKLGVYLPFEKGSESRIESISKVNPYINKILIKDMAHMIVIGLTYNFDFGRSFKTSEKSIYNADDNSEV